MEVYEKVLRALECYFGRKDWKKLFLCGGCFWLAEFLHERIPGSYLIINRAQEHCALCFDGGLYDVSGKISMKGFEKATERQISFMRKNYVPKFDTGKLKEYLNAVPAIGIISE
ncbi:MAG: hypothetical protein IJ390_01775 [Lachnospiraceae bacterium]|nr:hypothetical protein [Lachnospiraceae bacterium]